MGEQKCSFNTLVFFTVKDKHVHDVHKTFINLYATRYLWDGPLRRLVNGNHLEQLPHSPLFVWLALIFHILLPDLIHNEFGDLQTEEENFSKPL